MKKTTVFKRLLGYLKQDRLRLFFVLLAAVISTAFMVLAPFLIGKVTTTLFASIADGVFYWETVLWLLTALVALYLISQAFSFLQGFGMAKITANFMQVLRRQIDGKMHRLKLDYYDSHTHGDILSVITNDVDTINNAVSQNLTAAVTQITTAIGVLVMMLAISPALIIECLHHGLTVVHLLHIAVERPQQLLLLSVVFFAGLHHPCRAQQGQGDHDHRDDSQCGADGQHHHQHTHGGGDLGHHRGEVLADGIVDGVHIIGDDAENIAVGVGVVIVQLQPVHLPVDVAPELLHHMGGDPGHAEALEEGEQLGDQVQGHQRGQQPENGIPVKDSIGDAGEQRGGHPPDEEGGQDHEGRADHGGQHTEEQGQTVLF